MGLREVRVFARHIASLVELLCSNTIQLLPGARSWTCLQLSGSCSRTVPTKAAFLRAANQVGRGRKAARIQSNRSLSELAEYKGPVLGQSKQAEKDPSQTLSPKFTVVCRLSSDDADHEGFACARGASARERAVALAIETPQWPSR